jgi:hypothetical protein
VQEVEASPCEGKLVLLRSGFLCVAPLRLGGLRGKKSTPSIGWEVRILYSLYKILAIFKVK